MKTEDQFSNFYLFGEDLDLKRAEKLHEIVVELRDSFSDPNISSILVDETPRGPVDLDAFFDTTFNRTKAVYAFMVANNLMRLATEDLILDVERPSIVHPFEKEPEPKVTLGGFEAEAVIYLQESWQRSHLTGEIRDYRANLRHALDRYNLKFVVNRIAASNWNDPLRKTHLDARIAQFRESGREVQALDSAYYTRGNSDFSKASQMADVLLKDKFARMFVISQDELRTAMTTTHGGLRARYETLEERRRSARKNEVREY